MSETGNQTPSDNPNPSEQSLQDHLGDYIKRAREAQGIELGQLARENRMPESYLQALEEGNYSVLPGDTYTRAYLKSITTRLGLEEEKILTWYLKETKQAKSDELDQVIKIENKQDYDTPTLQKGKLILLAIVCISLLVAAQVFRLITDDSALNSNGSQQNPAESTKDSTLSLQLDSTMKAAQEEAPKDTASGSSGIQAKQPTKPDSTLTSSSTSLPGNDQVSANDLIKQDSVTADSLQRNRDSLAQDPAVLEQNKPKANSTKLVKTLIQISAKDSTWFSVVAPGSKDYSRVLRKGQSPKYLTRRDTIVLEVGKPDLIKLQLNSRLIKLNRQRVKIYDGKVLP